MMKFCSIGIAVAIICGFGFVGSVSANPILNGGFESPAVQSIGLYNTVGQVIGTAGGWTLGGSDWDEGNQPDAVLYSNVLHTWGVLTAAKGDQFLMMPLGNHNAVEIHQYINTVPGTQYKLRFAAKGDPNNGAWTESAIKTVFGTLNETMTLPGASWAQVTDPASWNYFERTVTADSTSTLLKFSRWTNSVWIDDVSVEAVSTNRPKYFGYYFADSEIGGHYRDQVVLPDLTRLHDYTNVIQMDITPWNQSDPRRAIVDMANLGYKIILGGDDKFPSYTDKASWQTQFADIQAAITGYESSILGLLLIDEPNLRPEWKDRQRQEELAQAAREYFHGTIPIIMNYYGPTLGLPDELVARNLDMVMFDYYVNTAGYYTPKVEYDGINSVLSTIRTQAPGKPIIIIGSSHSWNTTMFPTLEQQQWYYDTACANPDVLALIYFMLANFRVPDYLGAISYPETLALHRQMGLAVKGTQPGVCFFDRFHTYNSQSDLALAYSGTVLPVLTSAKDHGGNGKCVVFGNGAENAERKTSDVDKPGSVSAYLYNKTMSTSDSFAFKAFNRAGQSIMIYANGAGPNYRISDSANGVSAMVTTMKALERWQKVEFVFNGTGVKVYGDSLPIYQAAAGWTGGFSGIGLCDPWGSGGVGYVDDIMVTHTAAVIDSIQDAKLLPDGTLISIAGSIATTSGGDFDTFFYIEQENKVSGIRVAASSDVVSGIARGAIVNVTGNLETLPSGERQLAAETVVVVGSHTPLAPIGMNNRALGGGDFGTHPNGQLGVVGGSGTNNVGLLVKTWGRIIEKHTEYLLIDDGSGVGTMVSTVGLAVVPDTGSYVNVIGISGLTIDGNRDRLVMPRGSADIGLQL